MHLSGCDTCLLGFALSLQTRSDLFLTPKYPLLRVFTVSACLCGTLALVTSSSVVQSLHIACSFSCWTCIWYTTSADTTLTPVNVGGGIAEASSSNCASCTLSEDTDIWGCSTGPCDNSSSNTVVIILANGWLSEVSHPCYPLHAVLP